MSRNNQQRRASKRRERVRRATRAGHSRPHQPPPKDPDASHSWFGSDTYVDPSFDNPSFGNLSFDSPYLDSSFDDDLDADLDFDLDALLEDGLDAERATYRATQDRTRRPTHPLTRPPVQTGVDDVPTAQEAGDKLSVLLTEVAVVREISQRDYHLRIRHIAARALVTLSSAAQRVLDQQLTLRLRTVLTALWEQGWQPTDLLHVTRRTDTRTAALVAALVTDHARRLPLDRAPEGWRAQLPAAEATARAAGLLAPPGCDFAVVDVQLRAANGPLDAWTAALRLTTELESLPPLTCLLDPPSRWGIGRRRVRSQPTHGERDKMLTKIRALLAKAEATNYVAEAEALTAKAQDLMTRHSIDQALLAADDERPVDVVSLRVHIEAPYAAEKMRLLSQVAHSNRCKAIWLDQVSIGTLVGTPIDVDQVELLFTSLLIQATRAMAEAGARQAGSYDRSASFRRSFVVSYAVRIGERLTEATTTAAADYGKQLVPVLQRQAEAVETEFDRLFPDTVPIRGNSRYSMQGWEAGRAAADRATFVAGRLTGS